MTPNHGRPTTFDRALTSCANTVAALGAWAGGNVNGAASSCVWASGNLVVRTSVNFSSMASLWIMASAGVGAVGGFAVGGFGRAVRGKFMRPAQHGARSEWPDAAQFIVNPLAASRTALRYTSMGHAMRRLLFLIMFIVAVSPAMAGTAFQSNQDFSPWLTFYYENPEPNRVPDAIRYMSKSGILDKDNAIPPIFGFLSGVFRNNPNKVASWISQLSSLKEQHLGVVILGVWYAALPDSQKIAYGLLKKHPKLKPNFEFLYQGTPMTVEQIPLEQGSWVLDALWGKFMATGDSAPVERIISTLPWIDVKGDVNRLVVGGSAGWSLTSNAVQHKRVLELCETAEKTQNTEVAAKLGDVIKNAKNELQTRHNPAVNTDAAR